MSTRNPIVAFLLSNYTFDPLSDKAQDVIDVVRFRTRAGNPATLHSLLLTTKLPLVDFAEEMYMLRCHNVLRALPHENHSWIHKMMPFSIREFAETAMLFAYRKALLAPVLKTPSGVPIIPRRIAKTDEATPAQFAHYMIRECWQYHAMLMTCVRLTEETPMVRDRSAARARRAHVKQSPPPLAA